MKWERGVHHVEALAEQCARVATFSSELFAVRVTQLWAFGELLGEPRELDWVKVALCIDQPADDVPWFSEPHGAQHWANSTRLAKNPLHAFWRSDQAPVWNHLIERPVLIWDVAGGVRQDAVSALRSGHSEPVRLAAVPADELRDRLRDELAVSLRGLRECTRRYGENRWGRGKLEHIADPLWRVSDGYLDVLDAVNRLEPSSGT